MPVKLFGFEPGTVTANAFAGVPTNLRTTVDSAYTAIVAEGTARKAWLHVASGADSVRQVRVVVWNGVTGSLVAVAVATPSTSGLQSADFDVPFDVTSSSSDRKSVV